MRSFFSLYFQQSLHNFLLPFRNRQWRDDAMARRGNAMQWRGAPTTLAVRKEISGIQSDDEICCTLMQRHWGQFTVKAIWNREEDIHFRLRRHPLLVLNVDFRNISLFDAESNASRSQNDCDLWRYFGAFRMEFSAKTYFQGKP